MIKNTGIDVTVITYGLCVYQTLQVIKKLEKENISVHLLDLITEYPLDKKSIIEAANKTGKILLITGDHLEGSIMSDVYAIIAESCWFQLDAPVRRLAGLDVLSMPYAAPLERIFMISEV